MFNNNKYDKEKTKTPKNKHIEIPKNSKRQQPNHINKCDYQKSPKQTDQFPGMFQKKLDNQFDKLSNKFE